MKNCCQWEILTTVKFLKIIWWLGTRYFAGPTAQGINRLLTVDIMYDIKL